jgi:hypothetical protein
MTSFTGRRIRFPTARDRVLNPEIELLQRVDLLLARVFHIHLSIDQIRSCVITVPPPFDAMRAAESEFRRTGTNPSASMIECGMGRG